MELLINPLAEILTQIIINEIESIKIHHIFMMHLYKVDFSALLDIKWIKLTFKMCQ